MLPEEEFADRVIDAVANLERMLKDTTSVNTKIRLYGKIQGLMLALSYYQEQVRLDKARASQ